MLQKDYILEIVGDFVDGVAKHLDAALAGDAEATGAVEQDVAGLLDLDPEVALTLSPDSLVTMMVLSGMGDSVAAYVAFSLTRLADAYEAQGDVDTAALRRAQAAAVGQSARPQVAPRPAVPHTARGASRRNKTRSIVKIARYLTNNR